LKVLHLNLSDNEGGAARAAYRIHSGLCSRNIDSKMLVLNKRTKDKSVIEVYDTYGRITRYKRSSLISRFYSKLIKRVNEKLVAKYPGNEGIPYFLFGQSQLENGLEKFNSDIIHLHWINSMINFKEKDLLDKPIVWTLHDCNPFTGLCHYFVDCFNFMNQCGHCPILKSSDEKDFSNTTFIKKLERYEELKLSIICPSGWMAESAKKSRLFSRFPISVIAHGLDTRLFRPIDKRCAKQAVGIDSNRKVILFGAVNPGLNKLKGYDLLKNALPILKKRYKANEIQFVIFGTVDPVASEEMPGALFLGHISDDRLLSIIYSSADVMVVPSIQEAFGQTASEAMACGTPVTAFASSGLLDIVDHKINGYLAEPYFSVDLADGISWCLDNNTGGELSSNARSKAMKCFTLETMTNKYISHYKTVLKNNQV
jgi:glycosyltransferase involved in cell wall biosynthesis